jgi:hypothetical protein
MRPEEGARKQIEICQRMSGKERVRIAFEMWEMALAMTKASERAMHPELSEEDIEKRARKRMTVEWPEESKENLLRLRKSRDRAPSRSGMNIYRSTE